MTQSRMNKIMNGHDLELTLAQMNSEHNPERALEELDIFLNSQNSKWTQSSNNKKSNWTKSQEDTN